MTERSYPQRPDHPDYWLISQALLDADKAMDNKIQSYGDFQARYADMASVSYAAIQRAGMALDRLGLPHQYREALTVVWIDAFMAGVRFQSLRATEAQKLKDEETP